jgi:hypothetical protein
MTAYAQEIKDAQNDIKEAGQACTWRKLPRNANAQQPWKGQNAAPGDFPVSILFLKQGLNSALLHLLKNTDVTEGAPDAIMAGGQAFTPEITDVVIQNGVTRAIEAIDSLAPDGTPILYYLRFV